MLLSAFWNPLKASGGEAHIRKITIDDEGLRSLLIAPQQLRRPGNDVSCYNNNSNNVVLKSGGLKLSLIPIFLLKHSHEGPVDSCFLKSCQLCNKTLSLDKEVYMYRGDQGFCSIACRERQMYLDEIRELESSTRKTLASFRSCRDTSRRRGRLNNYQNYRRTTAAAGASSK